MYYKNFKTKSKFLQNNPRSSGADIIMPEFPMQEHVSIVVNQTAANHYRVFLDKDVEEPSKYRDLIQCLISASENDMVELIVSCDGGQLDSTIDIVNAIRCSEAFTRAVITSNAHSAGSMISLACEEVVALPHSCMLVHQPRGGSVGRHSEMVQHGDFSKEWMKNFYYDIYEDFFTTNEIDTVLNGKDIWLTADQINDRATKRQEIRDKRQEKAIREFKKAQKANEVKTEVKTQKKSVDKSEKSDTIIED